MLFVKGLAMALLSIFLTKTMQMSIISNSGLTEKEKEEDEDFRRKTEEDEEG
jgi:hypothetical protein